MFCFAGKVGWTTITVVLLAVLVLASGCSFGRVDDEGSALPGPSRVKELVREVSGISSLSVSPDGSKLLYVASVDPANGAVFLVVRDATYGRAVQNVMNAGMESAIWGPDGKAITYLYHTDDRQNYAIAAIFEEELAPENIVDFLSFDAVSTPAWSPDGRFIALWTRKSLDAKAAEPTLWTMRPDGSELKKLYGGPDVRTVGMLTGPVVWSPDTSKLLFSMSNGNVVNAFVMDRRGGSPRNLTSDHVRVSDMFWSPDGKRIGYAAVDRGDSTGLAKVWVMNADGSGKQSLGVYGRPVGWVPNSGELAFIAEETKNNSVWPSRRLEAVALKSKERRSLAEVENANIVAATVARDSRVFFVTANEAGDGSIFVVE